MKVFKCKLIKNSANACVINLLTDGPVSASEEEEDENEFYDALAEGGSTPAGGNDGRFTLNIPTGPIHRRSNSDSSSESDEIQKTQQVVVFTTEPSHEADPEIGPPTIVASNSQGGPSKRQRRTRIPDKPNYPLNLWSIMKNCIGKDLSKIPMPVNFSEPLSMLQRLTEDYEYADILDIAARYVFSLHYFRKINSTLCFL